MAPEQEPLGCGTAAGPPPPLHGRELPPHPPNVHPWRVRRTSGLHPLEVVDEGPHACPAVLRLRGRPRRLATEGGNRHVEPAPVVVGGPLQQRLPQLRMLGHEPRLLLGSRAGLLLAPRVRGGLTERRLERLV